MAKLLMKGNDAIIRGAILAGCRVYFGYPITPASEIAEAAAKYADGVSAPSLTHSYIEWHRPEFESSP